MWSQVRKDLDTLWLSPCEVDRARAGDALVTVLMTTVHREQGVDHLRHLGRIAPSIYPPATMREAPVRLIHACGIGATQRNSRDTPTRLELTPHTGKPGVIAADDRPGCAAR